MSIDSYRFLDRLRPEMRPKIFRRRPLWNF